MKRLLRSWRKLRGRVRHWLDLCPKCESDETAMTTCDVCVGYHPCDQGLPTKEQKRLMWQRFIHRV